METLDVAGAEGEGEGEEEEVWEGRAVVRWFGDVGEEEKRQKNNGCLYRNWLCVCSECSRRQGF